ncbi:cardiolipin synthase [Peptoniphilus catoniae]|uniref:cardiolipin synthase n=1 Tax=Peptoniphilus catoniae TaxID=1660341 RepID=UPI0010FEE4F9|nr:cardiolipin synthase [Peptoniphilus catoniae]
MLGIYLAISKFIETYLIIFIINIVFSMIIIFAERRNPVSTLMWVMAINFLPIIGFITYLLIGQDLSKKKMFKESKDLNQEIRNIADRQLEDIKSGKLVLSKRTEEYKEIVELFNRGEGEVLYTKNSIKKFNNGEDLFGQMLKDMKEAKNCIYLESYIFKSDKLGKKFMELLKKKAGEGLKVILLVDGMGGRNFKNSDRKDLEKNGVEVVIFFPGLFRTINTRINFRNHRKIAVIDHEIGYVGGFNIGDEYLSESKKFGFWNDTHLRIIGDAVSGLEYRFFLDYSFASNKKSGEFISLVPELLPYKEDMDKEVCIVSSGPDTKVNSIRSGYGKLITRSRKSVYIRTPYFIPDSGLMNALKTAALSGSDVNIIIPKKKDHPFVHWASLSYIGDLLSWGVKAYMYDGGFLHSKVLICDDYISSVGTANFDIRSFELNFEVNAFVFDEVLNASLKEDFIKDTKESIEITEEYYKNRSVVVKFLEGISRLLSPLL